MAWAMAARVALASLMRVEQHEVVDDAVVAHCRDRDAGPSQLRGVGLAFVAQGVGLVDEEQRGRQALELLGRGLVGRGRDLRSLAGVCGVGVPEPLHRLAREVVALGELVVGRGVHCRVGDRVVHGRLNERHVPALLGHERQGGGHVAADGLAGDRHPGRIQALGRAFADDPLRSGVALLDRYRVARLGSVGILDEEQRRTRADGELADEPVVGGGIAEDPAAAVHVDDDGKDPVGVDRADDADPSVADSGGDGDPLLLTGSLSIGAACRSSSTLRAAAGPSS